MTCMIYLSQLSGFDSDMNSEFPRIVDAATQRSIQTWRVEQVRRRLVEAECAAIVLFDPVHIRYATGTRNMQVWTPVARRCCSSCRARRTWRELMSTISGRR
ncbi:MAG: hypothetical protein GWP56_19250 [Gammaproteobacteria bacterium]|nr:hypothetical protein [Gammaproteobacteria bacterium]